MRYKELTAALKAAGHLDALKLVEGMYVKQKRRPMRMSGRHLTMEDAVAIHKLYRFTRLNHGQIANQLGLNIGQVTHVLNAEAFPEAARHA
jgi:hypothetical protein